MRTSLVAAALFVGLCCGTGAPRAAAAPPTAAREAELGPCTVTGESAVDSWNRIEPFTPAFGPPCPGHRECGWQLRQAGAQVLVSPGERKRVGSVPPDVERQAGLIRGIRQIVEVDDGWLVAGDAGEYGGGLWWVNRGGAKARAVVADIPIGGLVHKGADVWAFGGVTHGDLGPGHVLRVTRGRAGWRAEKVATLDHAVFALLKVDESFIAVTAKGAHMIDVKGRLTTIHVGKWSGLNPVSAIVRDQGNEIVLGMEGAVIRLQRRPNGKFDETWYVPSKCR
jgi:hypothetical protein